MLRPAILLGSACVSVLAVATPAQLTEREIRDLVSGATITLDAPLGKKIPVSYAPDGKVSGQARGLAYHLGAASDTGTWWIASGELCHRWSRWFEQKVQCLSLSRQGRTIHWRNRDGRTGTASVTIAARIETAAAALEVLPPPPPSTAPAGSARAMPEGAMRLAAPPPSPPVAASAPPATAAPSATAVKARKPQPAPAVPQPASVPPPPIAEKSPPQPAAATFVVANVERGDVLNVRSGPSADHDIVGALEPGRGGITIAGACRSNWCPITLAATTGWVNRDYLEEHAAGRARDGAPPARDTVASARGRSGPVRDASEAPRSCLTPAARALLDRVEAQFGPVRLVSTCRAGATIAGSGRPSRHASGNAIDFDAGSRKAAILDWLIANHRTGGTMTYPRMDHIHVDIGSHFVSIAGGRRWASWQGSR